MAGIDKINFNISPDLKRDIERLACSHGKTLSAFMIEVCNFLETNRDRIKAQAEREKQPINFGGSVETKKTTNKKAAAQVDPDGDEQ